MYLGSDALALAPFTDEVTYLDDGDWAILRRDGAEIRDASGKAVDRVRQRILTGSFVADKGNYRHFMAKEIHEQPEVVGRTLAHYVNFAAGRVDLPIELPFDFRDVRRLSISACGTAYLAGYVAKYWLEKIARLPVEIDVASEFRYREPVVHEDDLCVFISQSGETADTLAALRLAKGKACCMAIVNAAGSTLEREAGGALRQHAGPEIAVATTKGYLTQIQSLFLLSLALGRAKGALDETRERELLTALTAVPARLEGVLTDRARIQRFAANNVDRRSVFYIGRGMDWAAAMEGSLKLKEISYAHSEAYAAGELKHGTIALIEPGSLVIALVTQPELGAKMESNIREVRARGAQVLALCAESAAPQIAPVADGVWLLPDAPWALAPLLSVPPMQLFAYYTALQRGCDVDKPRNLAKSVTVE